MVIPNIGAFIAWGFITALFIPTGWMPNEHFAKIVGPMITYLLPVMIGSTGGHLVGGKRGAVMGGIGSIGVIVGADIPMFLGAMVMGPLGGWVIKHIDRLLENASLLVSRWLSITSPWVSRECSYVCWDLKSLARRFSLPITL